METLTTVTPLSPQVVRRRFIPRQTCKVVICTCSICRGMNLRRIYQGFTRPCAAGHQPENRMQGATRCLHGWTEHHREWEAVQPGPP